MKAMQKLTAMQEKTVAKKKTVAQPTSDSRLPEERLVDLLRARGLTVSTAESCTGGLIAARITDVPGSSAVLAGGCVSYTNEVKMKVLGVPPEIIERDTEVSVSCAKAMAEGARALFGTWAAVSTTGFAGPTGGTEKDPVGTVYIGVATPEETTCIRFSAPEEADRQTVRTLAATEALEALRKAATAES